MEEKQTICYATGFPGKLLVALLFIFVGILLFARNMGWISGELFNIIVSWHSFLIICGIHLMIRRRFIGGIILLLVGTYFLLGGLRWLPENSRIMVWPIALILIGVLLFFKSWRRGHTVNSNKRNPYDRGRTKEREEYKTDQPHSESADGFLRSANAWGAARHVMLDELFKGAVVQTSFGGTTIDLRHTHIAPGETYIDVDCNWGGVELYVPSDWKVVFKCNAFFGGCNDKRWQNGNVNAESVLVIRGTLSFGGLEVKD